MSVDPVGQIIPGVAGSPAAQTAGVDAGRTQQAAVNHTRRLKSHGQAERAAGISPADAQNLAAGDRDPDGRQAWVVPAADDQVDADPAAPDASAKVSRGPDDRGRRIDLMG